MGYHAFVEIDGLDIETQPSAYRVFPVALGEGDEAYLWCITVEWRGGDRWAVTRSGCCLGSDGEWEYEPLPSSRTDEWKAAHRFDVDTALRLAQEALPKLTVNGHKIGDVVARAVAGGG